MEGVTVTIVIFSLALAVLVAAFVRENYYQDGCDWDDDCGDDALDAKVMSEDTSSSDDWMPQVAASVSRSIEANNMNHSCLSDFNNDPRPCFDLVSVYDELGELGMNSVFNDSFSYSGTFNGTGILHD